MGMLVNGRWTDDDGKSRGSEGKFDHLEDVCEVIYFERTPGMGDEATG